MRSLRFIILSVFLMEMLAVMARAQLLPSQAKGAARAQIVMLSSDGAYGASIIVGYDDKFLYIATAAHIAALSRKPLPDASTEKF
jgi:hypothetical protein